MTPSDDFSVCEFFILMVFHCCLRDCKYLQVSRTFIIIEADFTLFTQPLRSAGYDTRSIFKRSLTGLNSEFSFSWTSYLTKAKEPSLSYYLPIAGGRIIGLITFPRVLVLYEMLLVSSRIWTRVAVSISYDGNHYTSGTSFTPRVFYRLLETVLKALITTGVTVTFVFHSFFSSLARSKYLYSFWFSLIFNWKHRKFFSLSS